jgi:hypothetical protein
MHPNQITKIAAGSHVGLVAAAAFYTLRIHNYTPISELSLRDVLVMSGMALSPVLCAWLGLWLARGETARWLLAVGQAVALLLFAVALVMVLTSVEPLAPLLLFLASLWIAGGFAVLLLAVWLVARFARG